MNIFRYICYRVYNIDYSYEIDIMWMARKTLETLKINLWTYILSIVWVVIDKYYALDC